MDIEMRLGRKRKNTEGYQDRNIDIDILYFNNEVVQMADLVIPHPRIYNRKFAMVPMLEIAPDFVDPYFQTSLKQLLENCPDKADVRLTDIIL
jgi:7,8-dihydro-6-hydroxymethylpterin-pyrophosphokinase